MASVGNKIIPRGKGWHNTGTTVASADYGGVEYEGTVRTFKDLAPRSGFNPRTPRSGGDVVCRLVRNVSSVKLLPKRAVVWATGYRNKRIAGYAIDNTTPDEVAGITDEHWPSSGIPDGELFWLTVKGPTLWETNSTADENNKFSEGDWLIGGTASGSTANATTAGAGDHGCMSPANLNQATTPQGKTLLRRVAVALSANTTNQTGRDVLVDVKLVAA